jgi:taurine transport system substrate-binding protein
VISKYQTSFVKEPERWGPDSDNAKLLAKLLGGKPEDQAAALKNLNLLPIDVQVSDAWLGGGEKSGLAKILKDTAAFLKDQKKITDVLPSYAAFVTPDAVAALKKAGS